VLGGVLERLEAREVDGALDLRRVAVEPVRMHGDLQVASMGGVAERVHETAFNEYRGHQATRERPHLVHRVVDLAAQLTQAPGGALGMGLHEVARELQLDPERHEPLLRAVVKVALDAPTFEVGGRHDPPARLLQLPQRRAKLRLEALVLQGHEGEPAGHLGDHRRVGQRPVVHEDCHAPASPPDLGDDAVGTQRREVHGVSGRVDPPAGIL
jgi:hypothetical protein